MFGDLYICSGIDSNVCELCLMCVGRRCFVGFVAADALFVPLPQVLSLFCCRRRFLYLLRCRRCFLFFVAAKPILDGGQANLSFLRRLVFWTYMWVCRRRDLSLHGMLISTDTPAEVTRFHGYPCLLRRRAPLLLVDVHDSV